MWYFAIQKDVEVFIVFPYHCTKTKFLFHEFFQFHASEIMKFQIYQHIIIVCKIKCFIAFCFCFCFGKNWRHFSFCDIFKPLRNSESFIKPCSLEIFLLNVNFYLAVENVHFHIFRILQEILIQSMSTFTFIYLTSYKFT